MNRYEKYENLIKDEWTMMLFAITCLAQYLSENSKLNAIAMLNKGAINLADFIEEAADLFFLATQFELDFNGLLDNDVSKGKDLSFLAESAVADIRAIWEKYGEWPEQLRFDRQLRW